jgi:hypothetical protein
MRPNGTSVRLVPPAPSGAAVGSGAAVAVVASGNDAPKRHECAAGAARALRGCGWPMARSPCLRRPSFPPSQATCAQPRVLSRCTSARGPRRCRVLPRHRPGCTIVQRRARTQSDTHVDTGPHGACGRAIRLVQCTKRVRRVQRTKGRSPWVLCRGAGCVALLGVQRAKPPPGVQGQSPARDHPPPPATRPQRHSDTATQRHSDSATPPLALPLAGIHRAAKSTYACPRHQTFESAPNTQTVPAHRSPPAKTGAAVPAIRAGAKHEARKATG